jgi:hypothetical protein
MGFFIDEDVVSSSSLEKWFSHENPPSYIFKGFFSTHPPAPFSVWYSQFGFRHSSAKNRVVQTPRTFSGSSASDLACPVGQPTGPVPKF